MNANHSSMHMEKSLHEYFEVGGHITSTRSADISEAMDLFRKTPVSLWTLRHPLAIDSAAVERFLGRLGRLQEIDPPVADLLAYGVDRDGVAFAVFPKLDGGPLTKRQVESAEAERRFQGCLRIVQSLHENDIICGDLCGSSFWLQPGAELSFIGVMGSFDAEAAATAMTPPLETMPFLAPEQRSGSGVFRATDVFALGVLGYYLFTGKYPFGEGAASLMTSGDVSELAPVAQYSNSSPFWADTVFARCLALSPEERFPSAGEVLTEIQRRRQEQAEQEMIPARRGGKAVSRVQEVRPESIPVDSAATSPAPKKRKMPRGVIAAISAVAAMVVLLLLLPSTPKKNTSKRSVPVETLELPGDAGESGELREAISSVAEPETSKGEKLSQIQKVMRSDDPIAHEYLVRSARNAVTDEVREISERAIIDRARRLGLHRSADFVAQWLQRYRGRGYPESYEAVLGALDNTLPIEARSARLRQAYTTSPHLVLNLAVALALDSEALAEYRLVISQLVGDSLEIPDADSRSVLGLILASPELASAFAEDVIQRKSEIPDKDIPWLLKLLADRNDIHLRAIASEGVARGLLSPSKTFFLTMIRDRRDLPADVALALTNAAAGNLSEEDLESFGRWYDLDAEKVLLAICADISDNDLRRQAFDLLAGKSLSVEPSAALVHWVRKHHWNSREKFTRLIGVSGSASFMREEDIVAALGVIDDFAKDGELIDILVESDNPIIQKLVVTKYSELIGFGGLLNLLSTPNPEVRKTAVRSLKKYNDIGALKLIIDRYEEEQDEEVRQVYKETFWVIAQREQS